MLNAKSHSDLAKARIYIYQNRAKDKSTKITICALKQANKRASEHSSRPQRCAPPIMGHTIAQTSKQQHGTEQAAVMEPHS